jgi:hypothetical protein
MAFGKTTLSIMTIGITTLSIKGLFMTLSINDTRRNHALHYAEYRYAECHILFTVMLSVLMLNVIMMSIIMLSVVAPRAPYNNFLSCPERPDMDKHSSLLAS